MVEVLAFTAEHVRKLTGLSAHQLSYWDQTEFFSPTLIDEFRRRAFGRIYSFRDLVGLRTIAILRNVHKVPLQELRKVGAWLKGEHETPWSSLRFGLLGRRVAFQDPETGEFVEAHRFGQTILPIAIEPIAHDMQQEAAKLRERRPDDFGRIIRNRYVVHNAWVVAGTRIPIEAIVSLHKAGRGTEAIIREYPRLTERDIAAALSHHPERRKVA